MLEKLIFILTVFWIWMLIDSYQNARNQLAWFWLVLFMYIPGALIYFFSHDTTSRSHKKLHPLRRLQLQQELKRARIASKCIGKAHQFLILGNILLDLGEFEQAKSAYDRALSKEPKNPYALWGSASVAFYQDRFAVASRHL
jgi:tetratricopeptide (TPR) repeat protein